jgi:hypothetical protein
MYTCGIFVSKNHKHQSHLDKCGFGGYVCKTCHEEYELDDVRCHLECTRPKEDIKNKLI